MNNGLIFEICIITFLILFYFGGKKFIWMKRGLLFSSLIINLIYLIWRTAFTLPYNSAINITLGIILLVAEWDGFLRMIVFYVLFWKKYERAEQDINDMNSLPTVDVLFATYDELLPILKRSVVAATNMDYPDKNKVKIYLCDDGNRPSVKKMCDELGINLITRTNHEHAKAGNLNHALKKTSGDLVVTMDADMVPRKDMLIKMVGHFKDKKIGFMQAPQTFYNKDPYQFNLFVNKEFGSDQDFFMRTLEAQKDAFNAVMYIGSNAIFRRKALESIGGFTTGVITEDMATGMILQANGWKAGFVNKNIASGLAPESFGDLIKQRDRWGRGNIQVAKKWNPLFLKGLTFMQRVLYIDGINYWFLGLRKMIFLLAPLWYMLLGFSSLDIGFKQLIIIWLPMFLATQLAFRLVGTGKQSLLLSSLYETATAPHMSWAILLELVGKKQKKFAVTRKGINTEKPYFNYRFGWALLLLTLLSIISLLKSAYIFWIKPFNLNAIYMNVFWISYNLLTLLLAVFLCVERPRLRKAERFETNKKGQLFLTSSNGRNIKFDVTVADWNENGARLKYSSKLRLMLDKYQGKLMVDNQTLTVKTIWIGIGTLAVEFVNQNINQYAYLIEETYAKQSSQVSNVSYNNKLVSLLVLQPFRRKKTKKNNR